MFIVKGIKLLYTFIDSIVSKKNLVSFLLFYLSHMNMIFIQQSEKNPMNIGQ